MSMTSYAVLSKESGSGCALRRGEVATSVEQVLVRATLATMPHKLAFMTVGILREPVGHEQVQGFIDRVPSVYQSADESDGFHARSIRDMGTYLHSWGEVKLPECYPQMPNERIAA